MEIFNTWQFNLAGYLVSVVVFYQFYKLAVRNAVKDGAATITLQLLAGIASLILVPFFAIQFPTDPKYWWLLLGACVFYALNDRLQTTARKNLQVSVFTIVNQLSTVFLFVFGFTLFKEPFNLNKFIGVLLILGANILLRYSKGKLEFNKYIIYGVFATLSFAIAMSIDIDISTVFNLPIYIMLTLVVPAVFLFFAEKIKMSEIKTEFNGKDRKYYIITSIAWTLAIFFSLRSFQLGEVTTVVPLQASSVLINVLIAYFVLGEKKDEIKKIVSALLVIAGIYLTILK